MRIVPFIGLVLFLSLVWLKGDLVIFNICFTGKNNTIDHLLPLFLSQLKDECPEVGSSA
jgi:hypothetical protein